MPWVWMPDSWVNAFSPTMALLGWVWMPVRRLTSWLVL